VYAEIHPEISTNLSVAFGPYWVDEVKKTGTA
jgi:hypothetical protein